MAFGKEVKDFIGAFAAGTKIMGAKDDKEYKRMRTKALKQKMEDDATASPIKLDLLKARAERARRDPAAKDPGIAEERKLRILQRRRDLGIDPDPNAPKAPTLTPAGSPQSALDVDQPVQTSDASDTPSGMDLAGDSAYGSGDDTSYGSGGTLNMAGGLDDEDDTGDMGGDTGGGYDTAALDMGGYEEAASKGGMITSRGNKPKKALKVKGYADGGAVEEDDSDDTTPIDDTLGDASTADDPEGDDQDAYEESALPVSGGTTTTASAKGKPQFSYQAAHDAVKAGVMYSRDHHDAANAPEEGAVTTDMSAASRGRSAGARAHASGEGRVTRDEYETMGKQVDPDNKLSDGQRDMAIAAQLYEYTMKTQGPEAAERAAASLTQFYRVRADQYKAIAQVAAGEHDIDGTIKNIVKSYNGTPTGDDLKITKTADGKNIQAEFTDQQSGKLMQKIIMTPDQMLQWASKGGIGDFDSLLARSAGGRAELAARAARGDKDLAREDKLRTETKKDADTAAKLDLAQKGLAEKARANDIKAAGNKILKPSDRKIVRDEVDAVVTDDPKVQESLGPQFKEVLSSAKNIGETNGHLDGATAFRAARELSQVDPASPETKTFKSSVDQKDGSVTVELSNGTSMKLSKDTAVRLGKLRSENIAAARTKLDAAKAAADRAAGTGRAISNIAGQINAGNPQPMKGVPVLGRPGSLNVPSVPLDQAPPGSVPYRGLGER